MTYLFLHIPKTGGMSLGRLLRRHHRYRWVSYREVGEDYADRVAWAQLLPTWDGLYEVIHSHPPWGIHDYVTDEHRYLTVLRHPVDMVWSEYHWILRTQMKNKDPHPGARWAAEGFDSFMENYRRSQNRATRQLAGLSMDDPEGDDPNTFATARQNLEEIRLVGVTERLDAFTRQLQKELGWPDATLGRQNVTPGERPDPNRDQVRAILRHNAGDLALWQYAERVAP